MNNLLRWLPPLDHRVWILIAGRLLSQLGSGFTLFYAPIFFVQQVGLPATLVGVGIGSGSLAGVLGRILGGTFSDSPRVGRRYTLLLSAAVSALADLFLALTHDFSTFLMGNLLMGFGIGLYWPATEATVADLTTLDERNEAFALTRLADSLGLGLGVVLGGALIAATGAYRALFVIDGISFLIFFGIVYGAIAETRNPATPSHRVLQGWALALGDRTLLIYVTVNILMTTYLAHVNSTLPLYFSKFVPLANATGFSSSALSLLFSWHVVLAALTQLPVARALKGYRRTQLLMLSSLLWGVSFVLVWVTGVAPMGHLVWAVAALGMMAIATVVYMPAASALVVDFAPESLRGVYLSINSLCWAVGYFVGPVVGGWTMDQSSAIAHRSWLGWAASVLISLVILRHLDRRLSRTSI
ncbi:MAG TPA: MFS transporter [Synechococcales cyanobacterium M55_K2018_004]|nr:MFS transporter [Synechococcales cyanobacterium M55_K2018_004]